MLRSSLFRTAMILIALASASPTGADESLVPEITAQGFDIAEAQEGLLGEFRRVRVRFEVPDRIEELYIKERSYDVDLAKTPEMSHFPLFGLETQVRRLTDVTLDFENYINEKIEVEGEYVFEMQVTDRKGKRAAAKLRVRVSAPWPDGQQSLKEAVEIGRFQFSRIGASAVSGVDAFGITWKTIGSKEVTIELTRQQGAASRLFTITPSDYDHVSTRDQLTEIAASGREAPVLQFATVGGRAAGSVFGVINREVPYLLKVTGSETSVSERGTTVTLVGEYKR